MKSLESSGEQSVQCAPQSRMGRARHVFMVGALLGWIVLCAVVWVQGSRQHTDLTDGIRDMESTLQQSRLHARVFEDFESHQALQALLVQSQSRKQSESWAQSEARAQSHRLSQWIRELESLVAVEGVLSSAFQIDTLDTRYGSLEASVTMSVLHEQYLISALGHITQTALPVEINACEVTRAATNDALICRCDVTLHALGIEGSSDES